MRLLLFFVLLLATVLADVATKPEASPGQPEGPPEGLLDSPPEGQPDGPPEGQPDGPLEGQLDGPPEASPHPKAPKNSLASALDNNANGKPLRPQANDPKLAKLNAKNGGKKPKAQVHKRPVADFDKKQRGERAHDPRRGPGGQRGKPAPNQQKPPRPQNAPPPPPEIAGSRLQNGQVPQKVAAQQRGKQGGRGRPGRGPRARGRGRGEHKDKANGFRKKRSEGKPNELVNFFEAPAEKALAANAPANLDVKREQRKQKARGPKKAGGFKGRRKY